MTLQQALELAVAHHRAGRLPEAEQLYRQVLAHDARNPDALHLLGYLAVQVGQCHLGAELIEQAIAIVPNNDAFHLNLGIALTNLGRIGEAQATYQRCIQINPQCADALSALGNIHASVGKSEAAIDYYRRAVSAEPHNAKWHCNLASSLLAAGDSQGGISSARRAIELEANLASGWGLLADGLNTSGECAQAVVCYDKALQLEEAPLYRAAKLYAMHFHDSTTAEDLLREHRLWDQRHGAAWKRLRRPHTNAATLERPLRIGYFSMDLREHPVGRFMLPLLEQHDKDRFEIYCYTPSPCEDALAQRLKQHAKMWRTLVGMPNQAIIDLIRRDEIDILVDLALMMNPQQMELFAAKPAPVQVTYLGYCSTTGLDAMDYRLTDRFLDPPELPGHYAERSVYLETTYWCYGPHEDTPEVGPSPQAKNGYVTFGCLNNPAKLSAPVLSAWLELLHAVPSAHLLLHAHSGANQDRLRGFFGEAGIASERIEYALRQKVGDYFSTYNRFDIALDCFPYGGGTTSCDALWMGVPLVTLRGRTAVGRGGVSLLSNLGLENLVADDTQQYIRIARQLAESPGQLAELRAGLRRRMLSSPIMNAPAFARDVERCYRWMWEQWCKTDTKS